MEKIKKNWLKLILWVSAYANAIIFALCGGYVWIKTEDEGVKKEIKKVFLISLIFIAVDALLALVHSFLNIAESNDYRVYSIVSSLITIAKIVTFVIFALLAFFDNGATEVSEEETDDENDSDNEVKEVEGKSQNEEVREEEVAVKPAKKKNGKE